MKQAYALRHNRLAAVCGESHERKKRLVVVFSPGDFKGTAVEGRAPRLSRVQPRLRPAMVEPLLLREEDKKHVDNTKNTPHQAVSFQMQADLWCS